MIALEHSQVLGNLCLAWQQPGIVARLIYVISGNEKNLQGLVCVMQRCTLPPVWQREGRRETVSSA